MNAKWKCVSIIVAVAAIWLLWPKKPASGPESSTKSTVESSDTLAQRKVQPQRAANRTQSDVNAPLARPRGAFEYVFDKASGSNRFLFGKARDKNFLPHSDAPSGMDLWIQDEDGHDQLIDDSVTRAKFSPDGTKIAFTTSDCVLHVQDLQGGKLAEVPGVYGPSWNSESSAVVFSKVGEGQDPHRPGTRRLTALNVATGQVKPLTDGAFDDGLPEFGPSNDSIIFVSGSRSGLASFWKVPVGGGEPVQLTNVGLQQVNEHFVPPPYDKTIWSADRRWFLYDFKSGDQQETWGLEFNADGTLKTAAKLAEGINPRWQEDGRTFVCERTIDGSIETVVGNLP